MFLFFSYLQMNCGYGEAEDNEKEEGICRDVEVEICYAMEEEGHCSGNAAQCYSFYEGFSSFKPLF